MELDVFGRVYCSTSAHVVRACSVMCMYARNEEWDWWWDGAGCRMPMLLCAYTHTVMMLVTVSNKDGDWGGIVITLFDSVGTILLFC